MMKCQSLALLSYALVVSINGTFAASANTLPIVDLGYAIHQATLNASSYPYYNFSNIRYGQAPTGALRFAPPLPPRGRNETINDGHTSVIPTQAQPAWEVIAAPFISAYLTGGNISEFTDETSAYALLANYTAPPPDPRSSEDCLFLDVIVPEKIYNASQSITGNQEVVCKVGEPCREVPAGAPVLVWIYGGGYTGGSKVSSGSPASLVARSQVNGSEGVIFVAMNYRLGLFGWLSGNDNVTANAGLLDQRLALEWVQKYIHIFGGDPSRVTVMGESAGGGSIMHHITSFAGQGNIPFQRAIPQSPAFQIVIPEQSEEIFSQVLSNASAVAKQPVTTAEELRALTYKQLAAVNTMMVGGADYGTFIFGPVIDGRPNSYVPDIPLRLVAQGKFHNISIMVGHNSDEGLLFSPPFTDTNAEYLAELSQLFPSAMASTLGFIGASLYPAVFNGTYGYTDQIGRTSEAVSDFLVGCNVHYLAQMATLGYGYVFSVPPGLHGQDIPYTFFNGDTSTSDFGLGVNQDIAREFQQYLTSFAMTGVPKAEGKQTFSVYGQNDTVSVINFNVVGNNVRDPAARPQCTFWAEAPYYTP